MALLEILNGSIRRVSLYLYQLIFVSRQLRPADFTSCASRVVSLLKTHQPSSNEVRAALEDLHTFSAVPPTEIVGKEVWGTTTARLRVNSHLKSDFANAVSNIKNAGHPLTPIDEKYLHLVLKHWCGWSATHETHLDDAWVQYLQALFPDIQGLKPILDSLVWPEEVPQLPNGFVPQEPSMFLLADRELFYVFILEGLGLFRAGRSLEEVYSGLKESRFLGMSEDDWQAEQWGSLELDERDYFPVYALDVKGNLSLKHPLKAFPDVV